MRKAFSASVDDAHIINSLFQLNSPLQLLLRIGPQLRKCPNAEIPKHHVILSVLSLLERGFLPCRRLALAVSIRSTVLTFSYHVTALFFVVTAVKTPTPTHEIITLPEVLHMCEIWSCRTNYLIVRGRM
jgi:hypothetical protein